MTGRECSVFLTRCIYLFLSWIGFLAGSCITSRCTCNICEMYFMLNLAGHFLSPVFLLLSEQKKKKKKNTPSHLLLSYSEVLTGQSFTLLHHGNVLGRRGCGNLATAECKHSKAGKTWRWCEDSAQEADTNEPVEGRRRGEEGGDGVFCWLHAVEIQTLQSRRHKGKNYSVLVFSHLQPNTTGIQQHCCDVRRGGGWLNGGMLLPCSTLPWPSIHLFGSRHKTLFCPWLGNTQLFQSSTYKQPDFLSRHYVQASHQLSNPDKTKDAGEHLILFPVYRSRHCQGARFPLITLLTTLCKAPFFTNLREWRESRWRVYGLHFNVGLERQKS